DEPPAESRFGLVPVADDLAVPHRLPDDPAIRIKEDAVAVGGRDARRHVGRQPLGKLRALDIETGFRVDHGRSRMKLPMNTALRSKTMALVCKAARDRPERSDQPGRKASVSGRSSYSSMPFSSSRLRVLA